MLLLLPRHLSVAQIVASVVPVVFLVVAVICEFFVHRLSPFLYRWLLFTCRFEMAGINVHTRRLRFRAWTERRNAVVGKRGE